MKTSLLLFAAAFLVLTGCRDYVVNPDLDGAAPPPDAPIVQLKGPANVLLGHQYTFKAEDRVDVRYDWSVQGPAGLAGDGNGTRFYTGIAQETGPATIRVFLLDASDSLVGYAQREVTVVATLGD